MMMLLKAVYAMAGASIAMAFIVWLNDDISFFEFITGSSIVTAMMLLATFKMVESKED